MSQIKRRETMRAEMKPDMYAGPTCDQTQPRWHCFAHGDKDSDYQREPLMLVAALFPPGTTISVQEPVCPKCEETREPSNIDDKWNLGFKAKCRCGFDWDAWTGEQFS